MSRIFNLIGAIIGIIYLANSFFGGIENPILFGQEVNIWVFRLFWCLIIVVTFISYWKQKKESK